MSAAFAVAALPSLDAAKATAVAVRKNDEKTSAVTNHAATRAMPGRALELPAEDAGVEPNSLGM